MTMKYDLNLKMHHIVHQQIQMLRRFDRHSSPQRLYLTRQRLTPQHPIYPHHVSYPHQIPTLNPAWVIQAQQQNKRVNRLLFANALF